MTQLIALQSAVLDLDKNPYYGPSYQDDNTSLSRFLELQDDVTRHAFDFTQELPACDIKEHAVSDFPKSSRLSRIAKAAFNAFKHFIAGLIATIYHTIKTAKYILAAFFVGIFALFCRALELCIPKLKKMQLSAICFKITKECTKKSLIHTNQIIRSLLRTTPIIGPQLGFGFDAAEILLSKYFKKWGKQLIKQVKESESSRLHMIRARLPHLSLTQNSSSNYDPIPDDEFLEPSSPPYRPLPEDELSSSTY